MKAEMEMAMKLLEKNVHEKQGNLQLHKQLHFVPQDFVRMLIVRIFWGGTIFSGFILSD
jgi:hypothetical protein